MSRMRTSIGCVLVSCAVVAPVAFAVHYVPFDAASFAAWIGISAVLVGLASGVRPLRFLGIRTRAQSVLVVACGMTVTVAAVMWPAAIGRTTRPHQRLDDFLAEYQFAEYHEARVRAPMERVVDAVQRVSFADMPVAVLLMRLRGMASGHFGRRPVSVRPILELMTQPGTGFLVLDVTDPREIVYGMAGKPWSDEPPPPLGTPQEFLVFSAPHQIRVAFNIRTVDEGGGVIRVSTETRTLGNDEQARRVFARYWRIIYPGSAIIRRVWLDAIIARAKRKAR